MMHGFGMWGWGSVMMIGFWIVILVAVVWLAKALFTPQGFDRQSDPEAILDRRLARGEIDKQEYEDIKESLKG